MLLKFLEVNHTRYYTHLYEDNEDYRVLLPNYKYTKQGEYNTILTQEMKDIFIKFLLHPNKFSVTKAIKLTQHMSETH